MSLLPKVSPYNQYKLEDSKDYKKPYLIAMAQSPLIRYIQSILHYPHLFAYLCKIKAPTQHLYHVEKYFLCLLVKVFEEFMLMLNYIPSILTAESFT